MLKKLIVGVLCLMVGHLQAQDLKAYQLYNKTGEAVTFHQMIEALADYDVVLFGEYHNNAIIHWLELKTVKALYQLKKDKLILGAEMFERDNQVALDRYLTDSISIKEFKVAARLWPNFKTDYKPLLEFAKKHHLEFIATNVPRRYASMVAAGSLDTLQSLPKKEKQYIAKLPIKVDMSTPGYKEMKAIFQKHGFAHGRLMNFIDAQATKDATMAESIRENLNTGVLIFKTNRLFLHYNGNYHSKNYGGIYWYLSHAKPSWDIAVITAAKSSKSDLPLPEDVNPTEFTIVVPADMTKTY